MERRGRKSAAAQAVVPFPIEQHRPDPPKELSATEAQVWTDLVRSMPPDWFPECTHALLALYCQAIVRVRLIDTLIGKTDLNTDPKAYNRLALTLDRERKAIITLSRAMRLTNQSRYVPQTAGRHFRDHQDDPREKWEIVR
jgi:hypothetical protein